ncbi:tektin-4-like [Anabas testudineus]|uniref:tektin-4-like n=1 Tax=Anabas testudineus TaxID=64144 RepID=UPI000E465964|nr:tektin-4-like [Anabas testudineus]
MAEELDDFNAERTPGEPALEQTPGCSNGRKTAVVVVVPVGTGAFATTGTESGTEAVAGTGQSHVHSEALSGSELGLYEQQSTDHKNDKEPDKYQAYSFDDHCGRHSNRSPDTKHHPGSAAMQDQVCNRSSWMKFSQDNLNKALQEEQATNSLRLLVEQVLQDTTEDLRVQCSKVDQAFSQRCVELVQAKTQLEMKLTKVHRETDSQTDSQDLEADRGLGEEYSGSTEGHQQQRGSTESSSVQT